MPYSHLYDWLLRWRRAMLSVRYDLRPKKQLTVWRIGTETGCVPCEAEAEETTDDEHKGIKLPKIVQIQVFCTDKGTITQRMRECLALRTLPTVSRSVLFRAFHKAILSLVFQLIALQKTRCWQAHSWLICVWKILLLLLLLLLLFTFLWFLFYHYICGCMYVSATRFGAHCTILRKNS